MEKNTLTLKMSKISEIPATKLWGKATQFKEIDHKILSQALKGVEPVACFLPISIDVYEPISTLFQFAKVSKSKGIKGNNRAT